MPSFLILTGLLTSLLSPARGYVLESLHHRHDHLPQPFHQQGQNNNRTSPIIARDTPLLHARKDVDPTDFSWVKSLAAVGDSFTAGIGAGNHLGSLFHDRPSWDCSRYDGSYAMLINNVIGPSVSDFQFTACSGDRSVQIFEQIGALKNNIDMVVMTAGGNDLCLAGIIKKCIILPFEGEETCTAIIDKATENVQTILKPNLKQLLVALNDKMAKDGMIIYNGYAQFFNTETDECARKQYWALPRWMPSNWFKTALALTVERRTKLNKLVVATNKAIRSVIAESEKDGSLHYKIGFSNWDLWPREGVKGQMCDPSSSGEYPDPNQPDLQFFKPATDLFHDRTELKRREIELHQIRNNGIPTENTIDPSIYDSVLWKSPSPEAEVLNKLDKRAPSPPSCPGDNDWFDPTLGLGLPDSFGKIFHPNELGHETVASFALAKAIDLRAKILGQESQSCAITDEFKCWQKEGRKGYATADKMSENIKTFCDSVQVPEHELGWKSEKTFFEGTPDEHAFSLQLSKNVGDFNKELCEDSFKRIVHGCDGNDPENPMNWKFGGRWLRDEYTYEINVKRDNRPWPLKKTHGGCVGWYKGGWSTYTIEGAGFSSWDHGQNTIIPNMKGCLGLGISGWDFTYFDAPDKDGNEWTTTFRTPIWVNARCFKNNKVVMGAGGFTDGCGGNDP